MTRGTRLVRGLGAAASVVLALLAGCGRPPASETVPPVPGVTASPSAADPTPAGSGSPSGGPSDAEDASFSFDDIASYQGDAEIEITGTAARMITTGMTGAESTKGQMVVVSVTDPQPLDQGPRRHDGARHRLVGPDDIEAPLINDPSGGLPNAFLGVITSGAEEQAAYGFAIPFSSLNRVRVTVDLGDEIHEPVSFAGAVEREQ